LWRTKSSTFNPSRKYAVCRNTSRNTEGLGVDMPSFLTLKLPFRGRSQPASVPPTPGQLFFGRPQLCGYCKCGHVYSIIINKATCTLQNSDFLRPPPPPPPKCVGPGPGPECVPFTLTVRKARKRLSHVFYSPGPSAFTIFPLTIIHCRTADVIV